MKIKFPIFIQYPKQYKMLMEYLDEHTSIIWVEGQIPSDYTPRCFPGTPVYICLSKRRSEKGRLFYKTKAEFERNPYDAEEIEIEVID